MQNRTGEKVKNYIYRTDMLKPGSMVLAGVSGGADSVTMLDILGKLQEEMQFSLKVIHVNHGIRGAEALRDQDTVENLCSKKNIPCTVYHYNVPELSGKWKMGHEEAGRKVRQEAFEKERQEALAAGFSHAFVAVAHNKNDLVETMLHHLARGTGLRGLTPLKPVNGYMIRPLLCLERREIDNYIKEQGLPWVTDSSNLEDDYTRNRIRNHILPVMEQEVNAKTVEHMAETSWMLGMAEEYIKGQAHKLTEKYCRKENGILLSDKFFHHEKILVSYGIREVLELVCGLRKDISAVHIQTVEKLFLCHTGKSSDLPYGTEAVRTYEGVLIRKKQKKENKAEVKPDVLLKEGKTHYGSGIFSTRSFPYSGEKILEKKYTKWLDCDKINCELSVRRRQSGDFMVVNRDGSRKKLTRCMIDDKIPGELRDRLPLVAKGQEILWIVGGRLSEKYKITSHTRKVLEIKYQGGSCNE